LIVFGGKIGCFGPAGLRFTRRGSGPQTDGGISARLIHDVFGVLEKLCSGGSFLKTFLYRWQRGGGDWRGNAIGRRVGRGRKGGRQDRGFWFLMISGGFGLG
jgi:hypothetical protein